MTFNGPTHGATYAILYQLKQYESTEIRIQLPNGKISNILAMFINDNMRLSYLSINV
jgi:hypothetical protein